MLLTADNTGLTGPLTLNGYVDIADANSLPGTGIITAYSTVNGPSYAKVASGLGLSGSVQVARDIILASGQVDLATLTNSSAAVFSGTISGPGSLSINARGFTGSVELTGTNTYTGSTTINSGKLIVHSDASLGASGGTIEFQTVQDGDFPILSLAGDWTTSRRIVTTVDATIDTAEHTAVLNGIIHGPGNLTKLGSGALILNGPALYTSIIAFANQTTVAAGTLVVNNVHNDWITVTAGTLGGHGTIRAPVTMGTFNGPGAVLAPAAGGAGMGPLTISESITFNADSSFSYSFKAKPGRSKTDTLIVKGVTIKNGATIQLKGKIQGRSRLGQSFR